MTRWFGVRGLTAICAGLAVLLAVLAVVQYRWATRVAAADAQREREHLDSSASLFANEFNGGIEKAMQFVQNDAWVALQSGHPISSLPKPVSELYYLDLSDPNAQVVKKWDPAGTFVTVAPPSWMNVPRCVTVVMDDPPAIVAPVFDVTTTERDAGDGKRVLKSFRSRPDRCFVARIGERYLRDSWIPSLVRESFGERATSEYDFAVVNRLKPAQIVYGSPVQPDLRKQFFGVGPGPMPIFKLPFSPPPAGTAVVVEHVDRVIARSIPGAPGSGVWELQVAHKNAPLNAFFEQRRRRDLLLSAGVELLLLGAIVVIVMGSRRMQMLANQKMQFVAGVSHELRTPVSAISMLSRNQADGLVTGPDKVKQYGELMHQQSRRLSEMVEQTLEYAGIESGLRRPAREQVDLKQLIEEAVAARREDLARGGFEVELAVSPDLPAVTGDAELLRTAFDNLLDNAHKHGGGGRYIRIRATHAPAERQVRIDVEDRGTGIYPADQAEIFEPFCRGRAAVEAQIPGSGLGLSLVRSAAEAHKGTVTLVSEVGRGSTFTMHLPV